MAKRWLVGIGLLAVLGIIVLASVKAGGRGRSVRVYLESAEMRSITQAVKASGQIYPRVKVNISAHVIGKIERLFVAEGDEIAAGEPFLQLEQQAFLAIRDDARARRAMAETELRQAEVALRDQEARLARARSLADDGITSTEALEAALLQHASAELRVRSAKEGIAQAEALLEKAEDDLRKTTIFSPLTGRVIALNAEQGEVVVSGTMNNPASVIGTVADLSEILAEVDVDETEIVDVAPGLVAQVDVDAIPEKRYRGTVVEVGSSGYTRPQQPDVQFFRVKVLLDEPDERLRPGMSARAEIEVTTHENAIVIPIQAVVERPVEDGEEEETVVFRVEEERAARRPVETGISDATHVEITSGLSAGDRVVTGPYRSLKKLRDDDRVRVVEEKAESSDEESGDEDEE
ncbi:MAG TPA: efflux RND transporter periplasmic adaptor subunit [Thermoanaerobaculia bacterium]|nr:efflux RND transporter periplasmic adaptor subunit [Thermoanaerobaculia bacterium]